MKRLKILAIIFVVLALIGLVDAGYLTIKHYTNTIPPCTLRGCETVITSQYNEIGGIPVALFGVIYYLDILTFGFLYLKTRKEQVLKIAAIMTPAGLIASIYFVYLQLYVIEGICQYCMLSAGTSTFLFIVGMYVLLETKKSKNNSKNGPLA